MTICRQSFAWRLFSPVPWLLVAGFPHAWARVDPAEAGSPAAAPACCLHCATAYARSSSAIWLDFFLLRPSRRRWIP